MSRKLTNEECVAKIKDKLGDEYDYSEVVYVNNHTPITLIHKTCGCRFSKDLQHILRGVNGSGCPVCNDSSKHTVGLGTDGFIKKAISVHGDFIYKYDKVEYKNISTKVCITCPIHGDFYQTPHDHLNGRGCPECGKLKRNREVSKIAKKEIGLKILKKFDNKIEYVGGYVNAKKLITCNCPIHGEFKITPDHLLNNSKGCPKCNCNRSISEIEVYNFIKEMFPDAEHSVRNIISPLELDIYIPSKRVAIEYCGLYWHSDERVKRSYHINKLMECEKAGIRLITIFEDEWLDKCDIVKRKLKSILGKDDSEVIYARKCDLKAIDKKECEGFMELNHIQGYVSATLHYGLVYRDKTVAVMSFKKIKNNEWELVRYSTSCRVTGGAGKILKYFERENKPSLIKSFADRRYSVADNNMYNELGFEFDGYTKIDYYYIYKDKRMHKFAFRKDKLNHEYGLPLTMTESEMTESLGLKRIYNCGLIRYTKNPH